MQGKVLREGGWVRVRVSSPPLHSLGGAVVRDISKKQTKARYWILGALCLTAAPASAAQGPFLPLSHIKVALAQRDTSTPPPLSRCSCLPVWVMNVYFTYRLSVCGLNGCHISNPSKIRTMCCHCNLKHPRGFFFGLVWV